MTTRYRLLSGRHFTKDKDGNKVRVNAGEVFESEKDDLTKFNTVNSPRFEKLGPGTFEGTAPPLPAAPQTSVGPTVQASGTDLDRRRGELREFTVTELRQYAKEENVDLGKMTHKDEIIEAILKAPAKG